MKEPLTEELLQELLSAPSFQEFTEEHPVGCRTLAQYLAFLLEEHDLNRADVVRISELNDTFGYQIFKGQRMASRDKILQLIFAMSLSFQEANRLLQAAGVNELYCKSRRDAILIFCLNKGYELQKTNEELYRFSEKTIC